MPHVPGRESSKESGLLWCMLGFCDGRRSGIHVSWDEWILDFFQMYCMSVNVGYQLYTFFMFFVVRVFFLPASV